MKGSVYKAVAPNGGISWRYQVDAGRDESGKRVRISESGFRLEREASDAMRNKMREIGSGQVSTSLTFGAYMDTWLPTPHQSETAFPNHQVCAQYGSLSRRATKPWPSTRRGLSARLRCGISRRSCSTTSMWKRIPART